MVTIEEAKGRIFSINYSKTKGISKTAVKGARLIEDFGLEGDVHGGPGLRQVSLLSIESIRKQIACPGIGKYKQDTTRKAKKKNISFGPGDFAENITTEGLNLAQLKIGDRLKIGTEVILEISKIGKECHKYCAIYYKIGDCIMPREGIFAKVLKGGEVAVGDKIGVVKMRSERSERSPERAKRGEGLKVAVLTISDRCARGEREDASGKIIIEMMKSINGKVARYDIVPDEMDLIKEKLLSYCDDLKVDFVFTTGGTGLGPRDITPEVTEEISQKIIPGISELIRLEGLKKTKNATLSRGVSAIRGASIIINLPGSPKGVKESLEAILNIIPHALDMLRGMGHN